ncbi:uncharacterized protein TA04630 [Theileria annulata]|uniref:Splicing factor Cactin n=1 Tax=Theileria annulata TaxID=5874 RepID=Q4UBY8_THEAN|nr:uncharacterized protein TA04630 [Theileria annulata]CAI75663.1 hypothetical protein, conserved [Theileria annulata]|eukprot:XP_955139.1 hypothetical protein, conserved [Theileria annulata]
MDGSSNPKTENKYHQKLSHLSNEEDSCDFNSKRPREEDIERLRDTRTKLLQKHFGYTDDQNPFGDEELTEPFVWEKNEKFHSLEEDLRSEQPDKSVQSKVVSLYYVIKVQNELKQLKQRRQQYEKEKSRQTESKLVNSKGDNDEAYREWEAKGVEFDLKQTVAKPLMRFKQGRPKLIDKLVLMVDPDFTESFPETFEPNNLFKNLTDDDVSESIQILNAYIELDKIPEYSEYFKNLIVIAKDPREKNYEMSGVTQMVAEKIDEILSKKSISELNVFEKQIQKKLEEGVVDTNFWETALSRIPYFKVILLTLIFIQACKYVSSVLNPNQHDSLTELNQQENRYRNEADDESNIRDKVKEKESSSIKDREVYEKFVQYTKLEEGEELFDEVVKLTDENTDLKAPMYYNRVKKGFEWTKYNLAHYDQDNPPPKQIQGYRFNIFFPQLKGKVPKWKLQKDENRTETVLIRFIGGHPYRDIAFRVVNREWNTDPQRGFKNFFDNGVLHLYFDFKKIKYRR